MGGFSAVAPAHPSLRSGWGTQISDWTLRAHPPASTLFLPRARAARDERPPLQIFNPRSAGGGHLHVVTGIHDADLAGKELGKPDAALGVDADEARAGVAGGD